MDRQMKPCKCGKTVINQREKYCVHCRPVDKSCKKPTPKIEIKTFEDYKAEEAEKISIAEHFRLNR